MRSLLAAPPTAVADGQPPTAPTAASGIPRICTFGIGPYCNHYFLKQLATYGRGAFDVAFRPHAIQVGVPHPNVALHSPCLSQIVSGREGEKTYGPNCNHHFFMQLARYGRGVSCVAFRPHAIQGGCGEVGGGSRVAGGSRGGRVRAGVGQPGGVGVRTRRGCGVLCGVGQEKGHGVGEGLSGVRQGGVRRGLSAARRPGGYASIPYDLLTKNLPMI